MQREPNWIRDAVPGHNPLQTDRNQAILPPGSRDTDPFLFLMEDWFSKTGFDWHPHRGFETVTYVIDGVLEHKDNTGAHGILHAGDLQWTTTGRGVLHTEIAHERKGVHTLQLWLNLPAAKKMSEPKYQDLRGAKAPVVGLGEGIDIPRKDGKLPADYVAAAVAKVPGGDHGHGVLARVFAGSQHGVASRADLLHPAGVVDIHMQAGGRYVLQVPSDHFALLYCIRGAVRIGDEVLDAGRSAGFMPTEHRAPGAKPGEESTTPAADQGTVDEVVLSAKADSHLIAYHGLPIREPVAQHGPFVMNSRDEIIQTVRDYQAGDFGPIPVDSPTSGAS